MNVALLQARIDELVLELTQFRGFRTLWLDPQGDLCHAEPDLELEDLDYHYVATLMRPDKDTLTAALMRAVPMEGDPRGVIAWRTPVMDVALVPAQA